MNQTIARQKPMRQKLAAPTLMPFFAGDGWRVVGGAEGLAVHQSVADEAKAFGAPQGPNWAKAWAGSDIGAIVCAVLVEDGLPVLSLPLEIRSSRGLTIATLPGGSHANGSFPALTGPTTGLRDAADLCQALSDLHPEIDALILERMQPRMNGLDNPLLPWRTNISVNPTLAANLQDGWEAWLKRNSGKKRRKKHRQDQGAMEALGPVRFEVLKDPPRIAAALDTFFAMKAKRFAELGIRDVFADTAVQDFFRRLATAGPEKSARRFDISVLSIGEHPVAIAGHSLLPDRMVCEFSAFEPVDTAIRSVSPSLYMHFESIRRAANDGYLYYDFSVGEERYKQHWCDTRVELFDLAVGLSVKGRAYAATHGAWARTKRQIKSNRTATNILQRLRRAAG